MRRLMLAVVVLTSSTLPALAADTKSAANTRTKKLQTKITIELKETPLGEAVKELNKQVEEAGGSEISFRFDTGVSTNQPITCSGKDQTVAQVLDQMFKKNGLGYVVISEEKSRYDGFVLIKQGRERGYPAGQEPGKAAEKQPAKDKAVAKEKTETKDKPADDADKIEARASSRLTQAETLLKDGKKAKAKQYCEEILKHYPQTKAAEKARELLDKIDK